MPDEDKKPEKKKLKPPVKQCPPAYAEGAEGGPTAKPKTRTKQKRD